MITGDMMRERLADTKSYCAVILHPTERIKEPGAADSRWKRESGE